MNTRQLIASALIEYDRKQSKKKSYNRNALGIYLSALHEEVDPRLKNMDWRTALGFGFCGSLRDFIVRFVENKSK